MKSKTIKYYRRMLLKEINKLKDYDLTYSEFHQIIEFLSSAKVSNEVFKQKVDAVRMEYNNELYNLISILRSLIQGAEEHVRHLKESFSDDLAINSLSLRCIAFSVLTKELKKYSSKKVFSIPKKDEILKLFRTTFTLDFYGKLSNLNLRELINKYHEASEEATKYQINNVIRKSLLIKTSEGTLDFSSLKISDLDLSNLNLAGADFSGCVLNNVDFSGTSRSNRSIIVNVKFDHSNCVGANFDYTNICRCTFSNAVLDDISLTEAKLDRSTFDIFVKYIKKNPKNPSFSLDQISMEGEDLRWLDVSYLYLRGVYFSGSDLRGLSFKDTDIHGAYFKKARFSGGELAEAINVESAIFENDKKRKFATLGRGHKKITNYFTPPNKKRKMTDYFKSEEKKVKISKNHRCQMEE